MKISILLAMLFFASCSHHEHKHGHHHRFDDAEKWAKVFEDKKRDSWQEPSKIIKALAIQKNSHIADIGSATGYFPVRLARVASKGRVWGVDVEPNLVRFLNKRARKEKIANLFSVLGTFDDPLIPEPVDYIFLVDTYHHIGKRIHYFENLKSSLSKKGKLVIIDFRKEELPFGPPVAMKLSEQEVITELDQAGYKLSKSHKFLKYQYLLVFESK